MALGCLLSELWNVASEGSLQEMSSCPLPAGPVPKHSLAWAGMDGWTDSGQQMSGCEKLSLYSAFEGVSFSSHPFHNSVWTQT